MKKLFTKKSRLYLITDTIVSRLSHMAIVTQAISSGVMTIQLRDKSLSKKDLYLEAVSIRELTRKNGVTLIINDHVDIALASGADGVHLGQTDLPIREARKILGRNKIIGISTRTPIQAIAAESSGADYIGFGPVFKTSTKVTVRPKGIKALIEIRKNIRIPVVAIGGINPGNAAEALGAGADAMAVASGILRGNINDNIRRFSTMSGQG